MVYYTNNGNYATIPHVAISLWNALNPRINIQQLLQQLLIPYDYTFIGDNQFSPESLFRIQCTAINGEFKMTVADPIFQTETRIV